MKVSKNIISILVLMTFVMGFASFSFSASTTPTKTELININTADGKQLEKLPRIGEKVAQRIIDFRKRNGKFKRVQDLMKVKGIGEKTFKKLEKLIKV